METKSKSSKPSNEKSIVDEIQEKAQRLALKKAAKANEKKQAREAADFKDEKIISINKEQVD